MTTKGSTKFVNFMTWAGVFVLGCGDVVSFNSSSPLRGMDQTNLVNSNNDQGRVYQNYKFDDHRGKGSDVRAWPYKSYSEYEQIIMLLPSVVVDSYLFYDVAVHFQI